MQTNSKKFICVAFLAKTPPISLKTGYDVEIKGISPRGDVQISSSVQGGPPMGKGNYRDKKEVKKPKKDKVKK